MIELTKFSQISGGKVCIRMLIAGLSATAKKLETIIKIKQKRFGKINYSTVHLYNRIFFI